MNQTTQPQTQKKEQSHKRLRRPFFSPANLIETLAVQINQFFTHAVRRVFGFALENRPNAWL